MGREAAKPFGKDLGVGVGGRQADGWVTDRPCLHATLQPITVLWGWLRTGVLAGHWLLCLAGLGTRPQCLRTRLGLAAPLVHPRLGGGHPQRHLPP